MRLILFACLLALTLSGGLAAASDPLPSTTLPAHAVQRAVGEELRYRLDFLIFKDLAEGELHLAAGPKPGQFRAELVARTLGVASWLSGERTQRYVSIMEADVSGRLRSINHVSSIHKKKRGVWTDRQKRYRFDYQAGKVYQEKGENGTFRPGLVFDLPVTGEPVDILTGFYNLRAGVYGKLTPGATLKIPTFTTRGISEIGVVVLTDAQRLSQTFFPAGGILLKVTIDPEVFETAGADLYVWFDDNGRPARGIVENVIGLGDVYGRLREEIKAP